MNSYMKYILMFISILVIYQLSIFYFLIILHITLVPHIHFYFGFIYYLSIRINYWASPYLCGPSTLPYLWERHLKWRQNHHKFKIMRFKQNSFQQTLTKTWIKKDAGGGAWKFLMNIMRFKLYISHTISGGFLF